MTSATRVEWITLGLIVAVTLGWGAVVFWLSAVSLWLAVPTLALLITLHSSLQHEVIHGHPTPSQRVNDALVWPAFGLMVPYLRFRDQHLAHHQDARLTDPYDDPESNYFAARDLAALPRWLQAALQANTTLLGRLTLGPALSVWASLRGDLASGDRAARAGWLWHLPSAAVVIALVILSPMPIWAYLLAAYLGLSILKIRTFLEHQAHEHAAARSVIIEDRGPLAFLFLNNNLHVVHHTHPRVPWYRLPALYRVRAETYLARNQGYRYRSYADVFRAHFLRPKDTVAHPLWHRD